ncbi:MAG: type II secretion system protein [Limisphaerales bacterium]
MPIPSSPSATAARPGFTLIELLITVAIIGVLAALLLPALSRAQHQARLVECQGQLRQLQLAYLAYTGDHGEQLPPNGARPDARGEWRSLTNSWCGPSAALVDEDATAIRAGVLFAYVDDDRLYRCPADTSRIKPRQSGGTRPRTRSYAVNGALRGYTNEWYRMVSRVDEVGNPASVLVFMDEHEKTIDDGHFMIHVAPSLMAPNLPAVRHGRRTAVSFLDGHTAALAFGKDARVLQRHTVPREP